MIKQDSIQIQGGNAFGNEGSFFKQLLQPAPAVIDSRQKYYQHRLVQWCLKVIQHQYFEAFIFLVIFLNTFTLTLDKYPALPGTILDILNIFNLFFTAIFTIEVLLKLVGLGVRVFVKEKFNQFDFLIVVISIVQLVVKEDDSNDASFFSSLRAFRLFKLFRLFKVGDLRILLDSIAFTLSTISDYVILLLLFMFVFALVGMSFFAGQIRFNEETDRVDREHGTLPRTHFDTLFWSVITIFQVMMGESWNEIMYQSMRSVSHISATYFIALVVGGNIIMLNLFLAILLGNFDKARNFQQKKRVFEAIRESVFAGQTLNETLDKILGDMSYHVKTKVLKWDEHALRTLHTVGDTRIGQDLMEEGAHFMENSQTHRTDTAEKVSVAERTPSERNESAAARRARNKRTASHDIRGDRPSASDLSRSGTK